MTVRRSPLLFCFLSLLLTACSGTASPPESAEKAKLSAEVDKLFADYEMGSDNSPRATNLRYLHQVRTAIFAKIDQPQAYQGQKCSVRLTFQRDGKVQNPTQTHGDPALCAEIIAALQEAQIPPAPDEQTYQTFNNAIMDFRP
ncbi:cell envelope integrity TolA C-terminal domain-containing protein [Raoultella ornithinolytica]|uniref:cell envelope integrity TolA C-terminal domain-containing protein n=1 Tax=Raoultella ornithinolytica TaxID=54291 RepID=UPI003917AA61